MIDKDGLLVKIDDDYIGGWVAYIESLNLEVFQNDDPSFEPQSSWLRLKDYIYQNNLQITSLQLMFRSHRIAIGPNNADGYFYVRGAWANINGEGITYHQHVAGILKDGELHIQKYRNPELFLEEEEKRVIDEVGERSLIRNIR